MLTEKLRRGIKTVYVRFDLPADYVVCDCALAVAFAEAVNAEIAPEEHYCVTAINRALLSLRKRGDLPQLFR